MSILPSEIYRKAGFPGRAVEGVSLLLEDAKDVQEKAILQVMYDEMINTGLLYPALEKTSVFPDYLLQMVKIGEETGTLDDVMNGLTHHYEREDEIEKSIKSALTYPLIMVAMMIAVIVILLTTVLVAVAPFLIIFGIVLYLISWYRKKKV